MNPIYLDNQATTPVDPRVTKAMIPYLSEQFGNAASVHHSLGRKAKETVEHSRKILANEINARPKEIVFTSGATESINLAIRGVCEKTVDKGHIITQATEHKAVLDTCDAMEKKGWDITILPVDDRGKVDPHSVKDAMRRGTWGSEAMKLRRYTPYAPRLKGTTLDCTQQRICFLWWYP